MGKVRVKTFGDEEADLKEQQKKEAKKAAKKAEKEAQKVAEPVVEAKSEEKKEEKGEVKKEEKTKKAKFAAKMATEKSKHSRHYLEVAIKVEKGKVYPLSEALDLLPELKLSKFDETVELHINTFEPGISGSFTLPHGTGKKSRVVVLDDALLEEIVKGKIDFDILLATPQMMPKMAKVARILGPRGLMPNPKNGTVTNNPEEAMKKYEGGHTTFKTENKIAVIHLSVGKLSFGKDKLTENIEVALRGIQVSRIRNVTLKSTMSPGIKIDHLKV